MRAWFRGWLVVLALVVAAAALGYLSTRQVWTADWSSGQRASLSQASRAVLARLHGAVHITSYARPDNDQRKQIGAFIARYQRFKPDITLDFVDPSLDPAATRAAGITVNGELVIKYQDQQRLLPQIDERHLTNALESLARGGTRIVAFVTGDGERSASGQQPADLGDFVGQLEKRGIRAVPLNFAQVPQVPQGTSVVVLASPLTALPAGAVQALAAYVQGGGNLLWLADPGSGDLGLAPLAEELGIQKLPGVLVDGQGTALGLSDPRLVAVALYPPQTITDGFKLATLFPQVAALAQTSLGTWKVAPILRSSAQSWNERGSIDNAQASTIRYDAGQGETKGPLNFGLALTRLSPGPGHQQQRVVVIGDGDFLSNTFLGKGGNRAFGERVFNWLLGDDVLIGVPPRQAGNAPLALSQGGLNLFTIVFLIALPILLALIGLILGWRRRRH
ncbi:MAG TPA: GldG family protein [Oleiagrimonas sp.]|nr:GldG family protein [Oleiagrimonas sp.]